MKPSFCFAVVLFCSAWFTASAAEEPSISISVVVPRHEIRRELYYGESMAHFHVIVTNNADQPQRIWKESCSRGYYGLFFEFTDKSGKTWTARKKEIIVWDKNILDFWTLDPHESLVLDVYFADGSVWTGFPWPQDFTETYRMRAVFAFSPGDEFLPDDRSRQHPVWTGCAVSKVEEYQFVG